MKKPHDIFITFAEEVVSTDNKLEELIEQTKNSLYHSLKRILQREVIMVSKGTEFQSSEYYNFLKNSTVAIVFLHPKFEEIPDYSQELETICELMGLGNENTDGPKKVFKIALAPSKKELTPVCFDHILPYEFFEKNTFNRRTKQLDFASEGMSGSVFGKLLDLSYDIRAALKYIEGKGISDTEMKYAYLGLTTLDQQAARDELKRELEHYGYTILPSEKMPSSADEFQSKLHSYLQKSEIIIQLMGAQYGEMMKGTKYSFQDFQNQIIREYLNNHEFASARRFIWIPQKVKISDQRQALYLKRIRRDDANTNTEIVETPLVTFKTILSEEIMKPNSVPSVEYENIAKVYLLTEEEEISEIEELYSALSLSGLKVIMLDYAEQAGIYARHLQALRDSDAVVIYQKSQHSFWLSSKLRDLIKSPGIGRVRPFKKVVIVTPTLPDAQLVRMIKSSVEVIDDAEPKSELILQKLITE